MPKFKVGDRVRTAKKVNNLAMKELQDKEGVIICGSDIYEGQWKVEIPGYGTRTVKNNECHWDDNSLELIGPKLIKVGDMVDEEPQ